MIKQIKNLFNREDKDLEASDKYILNLYRNSIDAEGNYLNKFLPPAIVKNKLAFEIALNSNSHFSFTNMLNNLIFSINLVTVYSKIDDDFINEFRSKISKEENEEKKESLKNYLNLLSNKVEEMKGTYINKSYALVDEAAREKCIPFFEKYGFDIKYTGEAEVILKENTYTEEEYKELIEVCSLLEDTINE